MMPVLAQPGSCTGCTACMAVCPGHAIEMRPDSEGFLYPVVDASRCTECGRCTQTCPVLHRPPPRGPLAVYAAFSKDSETRKQSSSGGVFSLLAQQFLDGGGVVFGAGWDESFNVVHKAIEDSLGLEAFRGSKYVQSDLGGTFTLVRQMLDSGRRVLFSGTPCQVAGLRAFLGSRETNLLCVDFVCHAVPSPGVFAAYKRELERLYASRITGVRFRDKTHGWRHFSTRMTFANDGSYSATLHQDPFLLAFLSELCNRPSCHHCPIRELRSGSDIVLGDYWGIRNRFASMDDDQGISLVLAVTPEGMRLVDAVKEQLTWAVSDFEDARRSTAALVSSPAAHPQRPRFFVQYPRKGFARTVRRLTRPPLHRRTRRLLGRIYRALIRK